MCLSRPPATHDEQNLDRSARTSAGPTPTSPASACATSASKAAATARSSLLSRHIVRMEKRLAEEKEKKAKDKVGQLVLLLLLLLVPARVLASA